MTGKQLYIFDFDGTLADSVPAALSIIDHLREEYTLPELSPSLAAELKHKSIRELLHLSGLNWLQLPGFLKKARIAFRHLIDEVQPIEGILPLVQAMKDRNLRLGILTSNHETNVRHFLDKHQMDGFEFVESSTSLFGKAKKLRKILKHTRLSPEALVMIGDEVRDMTAARKAGVSSVAVTWGFNSEQLLLSSQPDHLVHNVAELSQLLLPGPMAGTTKL